MISRWQWIVTMLTRRLWFRAALYGVAAIATALLASTASPLVSAEVAKTVGADSVEEILKILASSMLAVATFSLGTMVSSFAAAASMATPRASKLLVEDPTSQNVLSTFLGAFIFSIVGIIALNTHYYSPGGRLILFIVTLIIIALILITFFRWIDYLSKLGRLRETIGKVEKVATASIRARRENPYLNCRPLHGVPPSAIPLTGESIGYVQHLDVTALAEVAEEAKGSVYVARLPGAFVSATDPVAWTSWQPKDDELKRLRKAFLIGDTRSFEQDPRFGLIVLSEIASRALSPGINDPGTAIDIIGRVVRLLTIWATHGPEARLEKPAFERLYIPGIADLDIFDDVFSPISRDGAGTVEVAIRLQKAFDCLSKIGEPGFRAAARQHSLLAKKRSLGALALEEDRKAIESLAGAIEPS